jgi:hypothetical protein
VVQTKKNRKIKETIKIIINKFFILPKLLIHVVSNKIKENVKQYNSQIGNQISGSISPFSSPFSNHNHLQTIQAQHHEHQPSMLKFCNHVISRFEHQAY